MNYFFTTDGQNTQGPAPLMQLTALVRNQKLPADFYVCPEGGQEWKLISVVAPPGHLVVRQPVEASPGATQAVQGNGNGKGNGAPASPEQSPFVRSEPAAAASPAGAGIAPALAQMTPVAAAASAPFSAIPSFGDQLVVSSRRSVTAAEHTAPGTDLYFLLGFLGLLVFFVAAAAFTWGVAPLVMLLAWWINVRRAHWRILGNGLRVSSDQLPEIHRCVADFAQRLGMPEAPEVFVVEDSMLNAFATKVGSRKYILLVDDIVHGCLMSGETRALSFILGHELAHHALGHTGVIRSAVRGLNKTLSRLDEMSCDAVACALVEDRQVCARGLAMLLVGPQLVGKLNWRALDLQAQELMATRKWKPAEKQQTHPHLLRRYAALRSLP